MYDFEKLKQIPIASILKMYGIEVKKRSETEFVCKCPLPSHRETEHKHDNLTFCISVEKGKWYCHADSCRLAGNHPKGGDGIDLIERLDHSTRKEAIRKLASLFAVGNEPNTPPSKPLISEGNKPLAFQLKGIEHVHPFIQARGISPETAKEFGVGYFTGRGSMAGRIVFPIHEEGELIGYAGRTILPVLEGNPKWLLAKGLVRSFLYGVSRCDTSKPVVLVESPWAVLWLSQKGMQAVSLIACQMTEAQERRLDPFPEITIAMDNDDAGRTAAQKIAERLKARHKVHKAYLIE